MFRNFTQQGHAIVVCLVLSLTSYTVFSKSFTPSTVANFSATTYSSNGYNSFSASLINNHTVSLSWSKRASDSYFEVERSFDQVEYNTVALVLTDVDFTSNGSFRFKDNSKVLEGKKQAWYRIKEISSGGEISYSKIQMVCLGNCKVNVTSYPNPFFSSLNVRFDNYQEGVAQVRLLNFNGEPIISKTSGLLNGENSIELNSLNIVSNGIYIVEVSINGFVTERQKLVKK